VEALLGASSVDLERVPLPRLLVVDMVDTRLKRHYGLGGFGLAQDLAYATIVIGSVVCARSASHRVHATWGILFFAIVSAFEYANFSVLRSG